MILGRKLLAANGVWDSEKARGIIIDWGREHSMTSFAQIAKYLSTFVQRKPIADAREAVAARHQGALSIGPRSHPGRPRCTAPST